MEITIKKIHTIRISDDFVIKQIKYVHFIIKIYDDRNMKIPEKHRCFLNV